MDDELGPDGDALGRGDGPARATDDLESGSEDDESSCRPRLGGDAEADGAGRLRPFSG